MTTTSVPQISLGGDASHIKVGQIGFGLMGLTWKDSSEFQDDETMFAVMKAAVDNGATLWNSGSFYCPQDKPYANLLLIKRFFEKYPDYSKKVFVSVKGGCDMENFAAKGMAGMKMDMSLSNLEKDVKGIRNALGSDSGGHDLDLYEVARVDLSYTPQQWMDNLLTLQKKGYFKHISLSEVGASTIRKAAAIGPIASVEVEYSPTELSIETNNVLATCKELNIPIFAYSPVGKGVLAGGLTDAAHIPKGDPRSHSDRLQADNLKHNVKAAEALRGLAEKKGCTGAQLVLAWICHQWPEGLLPIPGTSNPGRAKENSTALVACKLSASDDEEIRKVLGSIGVKGGRYSEHFRASGTLFAEQ
jgi:pyridoxine 4-dehydrogenase